MPSRALVVDANILVRAVLGRRVREVFETYVGNVSFFVPEHAYAEAEEHLVALVIKRGGDPERALALLRSLGRLVELIGSEVYGEFEAQARERLARRDPEDWPMLAAAAWAWIAAINPNAVMSLATPGTLLDAMIIPGGQSQTPDELNGTGPHVCCA